MPPLQVSNSVTPSPPAEFELKAVFPFLFYHLLTLQFDPKRLALIAFKQKKIMQRKSTLLKDDMLLLRLQDCNKYS